MCQCFLFQSPAYSWKYLYNWTLISRPVTSTQTRQMNWFPKSIILTSSHNSLFSKPLIIWLTFPYTYTVPLNSVGSWCVSHLKQRFPILVVHKLKGCPLCSPVSPSHIPSYPLMYPHIHCLYTMNASYCGHLEIQGHSHSQTVLAKLALA